MALPATDAFTGTNTDPINTSNWTTLLGGFSIDTNRAKGQSSVDNLAFWDADVFDDDQYAEVVYINDAGYWGGPVVRAAATRGYWARTENSTTITLYRIDSSVSFNLLQTIGSLTISSGDVIRIEAEGTTIRVYQNGIQRGTDQVDATYSSGSAGIASYTNNAWLDDFEADNLGTALDTFRPSGTSSAGSWTATPSGTLHGVTSDESDSTAARSSSGASSDTLDLSFPAMGTPDAGTVTFYVRHKRT
jgi:hypothetical protein